jgi:hypothetical protein
MPQDRPSMFTDRRDLGTIRKDVLCAVVVLRELNEYGQHYDEKARIEIVDKALQALCNVWVDTGANLEDMEPHIMELLQAGEICRTRPKATAG